LRRREPAIVLTGPTVRSKPSFDAGPFRRLNGGEAVEVPREIPSGDETDRAAHYQTLRSA
jgi:hypothetical protein